MTTGYALRGISPKAGFFVSVALTAFCVGATVWFALETSLTAFVFGFSVISLVVGGGAIYAWWDWRHPSTKSGPSSRWP